MSFVNPKNVIARKTTHLPPSTLDTVSLFRTHEMPPPYIMASAATTSPAPAPIIGAAVNPAAAFTVCCATPAVAAEARLRVVTEVRPPATEETEVATPRGVLVGEIPVGPPVTSAVSVVLHGSVGRPEPSVVRVGSIGLPEASVVRAGSPSLPGSVFLPEPSVVRAGSVGFPGPSVLDAVRVGAKVVLAKLQERAMSATSGTCRQYAPLPTVPMPGLTVIRIVLNLRQAGIADGDQRARSCVAADAVQASCVFVVVGIATLREADNTFTDGAAASGNVVVLDVLGKDGAETCECQKAESSESEHFTDVVVEVWNVCMSFECAGRVVEMS